MAMPALAVRSPLKKKPANLTRAAVPGVGATGEAANTSGSLSKKRKATYEIVIEDEKTQQHQQQQQNSANKRKKPRKDEATLRQETVIWRQRYKKAFRAFVFYFDHVGSHKRTELTKSCLQLGATVENFFSNKVTHVVSSRTSALDKENNASRAGGKAPGASSKSKSPVKSKGVNRSPKDAIAEDELFHRASEMGIKVWGIDKVDRVLTELLENNSPVRNAPTKGPSLPHLLRAEALSGVTTERDPDVERADYNYFPPKSYYCLVEDASGEHRTIIAKEYEKPRLRGEAPEWPILHGGVEGRPAFTSRDQTVPPLPKGKSHPAAPKHKLAATTQTNPLLAPPSFKAGHGGAGTNGGTGAAGLRRSASLNSFSKSLSLNKRFASVAAADFLKRQNAVAAAAGDPKADAQQESGALDEYIAASGNSQPLTSNMASMTSGAPLSANGQPTQAGVMLDARLAHLNKRQIFINQVGLHRATTSSQGLLQVPKPVPGKLVRRSSAAGLQNQNPARPDEPSKPGYCENCRMRYDDFREHCEHKKHRRFALDGRNWLELDDLLYQVAREVLPAYRMIELDSDCDEDEDEDGEEAEEISEMSYAEADEDMHQYQKEWDVSDSESEDAEETGEARATAQGEAPGAIFAPEEEEEEEAVEEVTYPHYGQVVMPPTTSEKSGSDQLDEDEDVEMDTREEPLVVLSPSTSVKAQNEAEAREQETFAITYENEDSATVGDGTSQEFS